MGSQSGTARFARAGLVLLLSMLLAAGAGAGIIYWAWQGSLIGVVLSALLPGSLATVLASGEPRRTRPSGK